MTAPGADVRAVLDLLDEDTRNDLRALGVELMAEREAEPAGGPRAMPTTRDQAQRDALASVLMRRQAELLAEVGQLTASEHAEIQYINRRYSEQIGQCQRRADLLARAVEAIAEQTKLTGGFVRKRSKDVGAGTYGFRHHEHAIEIVDDATALAWAEATFPSLVQVTIKVRLDDARERFTETELSGATRALVKFEAKRLVEHMRRPAGGDDESLLPPGFGVRPAHDTFYASPLPAAAISGVRTF